MSDKLLVKEDYGAGVTAVTSALGEHVSYRVEVGGLTAWSKSATLARTGMAGAGHRVCRDGQREFAEGRARSMQTQAKGGSQEAAHVAVQDTERFAYQETPSSSKSDRVGYCYAAEVLRVVFKGGAAAYVYSGVPPGVWHSLLDTVLAGGSVGSFLSRAVEKGGFEYEREQQAP